MKFKEEFIFNNLKHIKKLNCMTEHYNCEFLYSILWYFVSKDCFWQRSNLYDAFFEKEKVFDDAFFTIWFFKKINLREIIIFDSLSTMNEFIDALEMLENDVLYLYVNASEKQTLFSSLFSKLRNSIAHGTFNSFNKSFLFIGQKSPHKEGKDLINFLFNISNIESLKSVMTELSDGVDSFFNAFCKISNNVSMYDGKCYIGEKELILLENFLFEKSKKMSHEKQLIAFLEANCISNSVVLIEDTLSAKYDDEWFNHNNIEIINLKHIYSFLGLNIKVGNT